MNVLLTSKGSVLQGGVPGSLLPNTPWADDLQGLLVGLARNLACSEQYGQRQPGCGRLRCFLTPFLSSPGQFTQVNCSYALSLFPSICFVETGLEYCIENRLTLNLWSSCLHPSNHIDMYYHAQVVPSTLNEMFLACGEVSRFHPRSSMKISWGLGGQCHLKKYKSIYPISSRALWSAESRRCKCQGVLKWSLM